MAVDPYNNLNHRVVTTIPGTFIINRSYNISRQMEYVGYAPRGTADSDRIWIIRRYTYVNNQITQERVAVEASWDERELATTNYA